MKMSEACGRYAYGWDMSGDGVTTITDISLLLKAIFLAPSNFAADVFQSDPKIAAFFEMTCDTGLGWGGAVFSFFFWIIAWAILMEAISPSR